MRGQTAVTKSIRQNKPIDCGAVSLEKVPRLLAYPAVLRQFLVFALQKLARAISPYICDGETARLIAGRATDDVVDTAFAVLKSQLAFMGVKIPTLYKQYTDLCVPGGTRFCGINIDENFGYCVDGLVMVNLDQVKAKKRARYIERYNVN
jgi:hypothetical protein